MKTIFCLGFLLLICQIQFGIAIPKANKTGNAQNVDDFIPYLDTSLSDSFDWMLLKAFSGKDLKNVIISPLSLKLVLGLIYEGASGYTEREFQTALQFPEDKKVLRENFSKIIQSLQIKDPDYLVNIAMSIFLDSSLQPEQKFSAIAHDSYKAKVTPTNFTDKIKSSDEINSWVKEFTNGYIKKLVTPDDLENAILLAANAIYFKGVWRSQFPHKNTHKGGFYVNPTNVVNDIEYMTNTDSYFFTDSKELRAQIIRMPYKGNKYSMFIVLPYSKGGLQDLINNLNVQVLRRSINAMETYIVELTLPKFKFDFQSRFAQFLKERGLQKLFDNTASLPGIVRGINNQAIKTLFVSDIVQKAGIEVDEEGSTLYAATEVQLVNKFGEPDISFNASYPFLFFLTEQTTGSVLFVGKVENPIHTEPIPLPSRFSDDGPITKPISRPQQAEKRKRKQPKKDID